MKGRQYTEDPRRTKEPMKQELIPARRTNEAGTYTCVIVQREVLQNMKAGSRESLGLGSNAKGIGGTIGALSEPKRL